MENGSNGLNSSRKVALITGITGQVSTCFSNNDNFCINVSILGWIIPC